MLILARKVGEKIVIGDREIVITVTKIDGGNRVQLGFEAAPDVKVLRQELLDGGDGGKCGGKK